MPFEPRKIVKLAEPGQVHGYGRLIRKDLLDEDYAESASIAYGRPGHPVIVHEFDLPKEEDDRKELMRYVSAEQRTALRLINDADARKVLPRPESFTLLTRPADIERFQVSVTTSEVEQVVRTFIVFHPNGRPITRRSRKNDDEEEPEPIPIAELPSGPGIVLDSGVDPDETDMDRKYEAQEVSNRLDVGPDPDEKPQDDEF